MADNEMRIKIVVDQSQYQSAMKNFGKQQGSLIDGFGKAGKAGGLFGRQVSQGMEQASSSASKGVKAWSSFNTGFGTVTAALTPFTLAMQAGGKAIGAAGGFIKSSLSDYATFESTLKQVQIIAGGTDADMKLLGDTAKKLGANTSIGAQEVANAEVEFAKLGFTASETADAMTGIVYASEASGSSMETTSTIVASALNTWNLKASDATHVADVLAQTANQTAADMTDLGYTFQYAGATAQLGGASMEQLAAYTGIMADQGIKGSKAGTTLRTAFINLTKPTEGAAAKLQELGVNLKDTEGNARPIPSVIADLQDKMQGMSKSDIMDISTILFGKTGAAGMSMVLQKTSKETADLTKSLVDSTGTAEAQAKKMRETLAGQLDQIQDGFATLKLKIGEAFAPLATEGAKAINGVLDDLSGKVDQAAVSFKGFTESANFGAMKQSFGELAGAAGDMFDKMLGSGGFKAIADDVVQFSTQIANAGTDLMDFASKSGGAIDFFDDLNQKLKDASKAVEEANPIAQGLNKLFGKDKSKEAENHATAVGKFALAVRNMNVNAREIQADPFSSMNIPKAEAEMRLIGTTMADLTEKGRNFTLIDEAQVTAFQGATQTIQTDLNLLTAKVAAENAKYAQDPSYNPAGALAKATQASLPAVQEALNTQVATTQAANTRQLDILTQFMGEQTMLTTEQQASLLAAVQTGNDQQVAEQQTRNQEILTIYQNLSNMTVDERNRGLARIADLERQNTAQVVQEANIRSQSIVQTLAAQVAATGSLSEEQKQTAITAANTQRDETVKAAQDQYVQRVAAIKSMTTEEVTASGHSRDELIRAAADTMIGTVGHAETMRTETVGKIEDIASKAAQTDGTKINIDAITNGFDDAVVQMERVLSYNGRTVTIPVMTTTVAGSVDAAKAAGGAIPTQARGGLTSGVAATSGTGQATFHPGASAAGRGNQLGQGGFSMSGGGVITNERGREVTMPVGNTTYMRPFARAIADELRALSGGGGAQEIVVPVYLDSREFAIATNKDMSTEQAKYKALKNRARGKK